MKIKFVKFYQSVRFNSIERASVTSLEFTPMRTTDENMQISVNDRGVLLENDKEATQVSWNNVAYINYAKSAEPTQELSEKQDKQEPKKKNFREI